MNTYETFVSAHTAPDHAHGTLGFLHAAMGLAGEAFEFHRATGRANALEELGDLEFYWTMLGNVIEVHPPPRNITTITCPFDFLSGALLATTIHLLDRAKKIWVYGQPLSLHRDSAITEMNILRYNLDEIYSFLGIAREVVLTQNMEKIRLRYPPGHYTDQHALQRLDGARDGN